MCKFDKQHIVEELKSKLGFGWYVYPVNIHQHTEKKNYHLQPRAYLGVVYCVHCRSNNIIEILKDSYGTMSGGATEWVYQCKDCKKSMTVEYEWE